METKQTAVDWLSLQVKNSITLANLLNQIDAFEKEAKAMEKEQEQLARKESYNEGWLEATQYIFKKYKQEDNDKI